MQRVLFINTSGATGTVTLADENGIVATRSNASTRDHAAYVNPAIELLLAEAEWKLADLTGICVMAGPGSYTGLRIGLATAKGICYALDIPLFLQNNLEVLAYAAQQQQDGIAAKHYVPLLKARTGEYFVAAYNDALFEVQPPQHLVSAATAELCEQLKPSVLLCLDADIPKEIFGERVLKGVSIEVLAEPAVQSVVSHGMQLIKKNCPIPLNSAAPFYLKSPFTTTPATIQNASH